MSEMWIKDEATQWLSRVDAVIAEACLAAATQPNKSPVVLEIGVFRGGWTGTLATNGPANTRHLGIDPYPQTEEIREEMLQRLQAAGVADRYHHFDSWSDLFMHYPNIQESREIEVVHIDGEHTQSSVQLDLEMAASVLSSQGIIVLDDVSNPWFPGIPAALFSFLEKEDFALLLYSRTKAYICRRPAHDGLRDALRRQMTTRNLTLHDFLWQERAEQLGYREPQRVFGADVLLCVSSDNDRIYPEYSVSQPEPTRLSRFLQAWAPPVLRERLIRR